MRIQARISEPSLRRPGTQMRFAVPLPAANMKTDLFSPFAPHPTFPLTNLLLLPFLFPLLSRDKERPSLLPLLLPLRSQILNLMYVALCVWVRNFSLLLLCPPFFWPRFVFMSLVCLCTRAPVAVFPLLSPPPPVSSAGERK